MQQAVEEGPIALQGYAELFRRYLITSGPLLFEGASATSEGLHDTTRDLVDKLIRLFHGSAWIIHKRSLYSVPSASELACLLGANQGLNSLRVLLLLGRHGPLFRGWLSVLWRMCPRLLARPCCVLCHATFPLSLGLQQLVKE